MAKKDYFNARKTFDTGSGEAYYYSLEALEQQGFSGINRLPFSIKILLEAVLRNCDGYIVEEKDVKAVAGYDPKNVAETEVPFMPARVVLQDFTGVPAVVDLAALRSAMARMNGDPSKINPQVPVDLVIDHSVQVDTFGSDYAFMFNVKKEMERNKERYEFLRWGKEAFDNFDVVPPGRGIVHQVNLEYLAKGVFSKPEDDLEVVYPDSLVGTDSHTTMINGLGIVGWGVGGIEAEAVMLGQPIYMLLPEVVGFKITGKLREGITATDLVLTVTEMLRKKGVVGKFVEFYGAGVSEVPLANRATIGNMSPEFGSTAAMFPVDQVTLDYLALTGRDSAQIDLVEAYAKAQGLWHDAEREVAQHLD